MAQRLGYGCILFDAPFLRQSACQRNPFAPLLCDPFDVPAKVGTQITSATPEEIGDDQPLFGPGSLGLDSVDALQLVVALDKSYGLKIPDAAVARKTLRTVNNIAEAVAACQAGRQ